MAAYGEVGDTKVAALAERMRMLGVREADLTERFVLGSGSGGQKVNKTSSCVVLRHGPSGIVVKTQATRSRELNRYYARKELCDRIEQRERGECARRQAEQERIRRQKRRRSRRQRERMLEDKAHHGQRKALRRKVVVEE